MNIEQGSADVMTSPRANTGVFQVMWRGGLLAPYLSRSLMAKCKAPICLLFTIQFSWLFD